MSEYTEYMRRIDNGMSEAQAWDGAVWDQMEEAQALREQERESEVSK